MATLTANVTATVEVMPISAPLAAGVKFLRIDDELVAVGSAAYRVDQRVKPNALRVGVVRGAEGTTAASHLSGATIAPYLDAYSATTPFAGAGGGGSLPDWFVADENNQTFDFFGGFHLNSSDTPPVGNGDVTITIDGRDSSGALVSLTPTATNQRPLDIVAPAGQSTALIAVRLNGTDRFLLTSTGALTLIPGGVDQMLQVNAGDVAIAGSTVYIENDLIELGSSTTLVIQDGVVGFFGATPAAQGAANPDTSGATLANLETEVNQLKALLRAFGLLAT